MLQPSRVELADDIDPPLVLFAAAPLPAIALHPGADPRGDVGDRLRLDAELLRGVLGSHSAHLDEHEDLAIALAGEAVFGVGHGVSPFIEIQESHAKALRRKGSVFLCAFAPLREVCSFC